MGKQKNVMLDYLRDNRRFADLFNGGLFAGEQVISSSDFMDASDDAVRNKEYEQLDEETARVIGTVMGVDTFMMNKNRYEKEGEYNMCQAIREMCEDNWNEGVEAGTLNAIKNLMETLTFTASQAMDALKIPAEEREKYMQMLNS